MSRDLCLAAATFGSVARNGVGVRLSPLAPLYDLRIFALRRREGHLGKAVLLTLAYGSVVDATSTCTLQTRSRCIFQNV